VDVDEISPFMRSLVQASSHQCRERGPSVIKVTSPRTMEGATLTDSIPQFRRPFLNISSDRHSELDLHRMRQVSALEWEGAGEFTHCLGSIGTSRSIRSRWGRQDH
jgi:hypothetical protein